mmetsp:Transcript_9979/g.13565  ORF Transcript_9979/g.13565 Transcript_9979/m.13565 type:complete len:215 (+) Transcript_9979:90-734(+)|eukprot:CAMPEP_0170470764 /NCGR_PEP_ID=MMETSP0123-20130129/13132_1 /TAXON_ID=182087 /ORGANISM="Favella ehrenbergii, Strain Fehren 1" /LENGTH=214 /DNA_ID=CAMNT_0010738035 /DNA_START=3755 /DNA_END=4399 /DNA_ORIENTATION=-
MELPPLGKVGIVGNKGSGRSTIAHLLRRFYDLDIQQYGAIKIDGQDLKNYSARVLRSSIQHLPQEPVILDVSIRDNIAIGRSDASDEQIYRAALLANATSFIEDVESNENARSMAVSNRLSSLIGSLAIRFPELKKLLTVKIRNDDLAQTNLQQLLLETLKYADLRTISKIEADPLDFADRAIEIMEGSSDENMTWLELILMVEWQTELQGALE